MKIIKETTSLYEMANIDKRDTNLPVNIWVHSSHCGKKTAHHLPRVKMQKFANNDNSESNVVPVSISLHPKILVTNCKLGISKSELSKVFNFISNNYDLFMSHWNCVITDKQLLDNLVYD